MLTHSPDNIALFDLDGRYLYINPCLERSLGIPAGELIGTILHDSLSAVKNAIAEVIATGKTVTVRQQDPQGGEEEHEVILTPELDDTGKLIAVLCVGRNLTTTYAALKKREQEFRSLAENLPEMISRYTPDARLIYMNPALEQIHGIRLKDTQGQPPSARSPQLVEFEKKVVEVGRTGRGAVIEMQFTAGDGRVIDHRVSLVPEHNASGKIVSVLSVGTDISLFKQQEKRESVRSRIYQLLLDDAGLGHILETVIQFVESSTQGTVCSILLANEARTHLVMGAAPNLPANIRQATDGLPIGEGAGCCGAAAWRRERVIVEDIAASPLWAGMHPLAAEAGLAACWSEPIIDGEGKVLGTFAIFHRQPKAPTDEDIALMEQATQLARLSIERNTTQRLLTLRDAMIEQASDAIYLFDPSGTFHYVNQAACASVGMERSKLIGKRPGDIDAETPTETIDAIISQAMKDGSCGPFESTHRHSDGSTFPVELKLVMFTHDNASWGVVIARDISERKEFEKIQRAHEQDLLHSAYHDLLTGLPNRLLLADRLAQNMAHSARSGKQLAVAYLDLDGFKDINDRHGHTVGDRVLMQIAGRLSSHFRSGDTVARVGGDEFVLLLTDTSDGHDLAQVMRRLLVSIAEPIVVDALSFSLSASIGIALYPDDADDPDLLLRNADQAMYVAKRTGRNQCVFYAREASVTSVQRSVTTHDLKQALHQGDIVPYFQPVVCLKTGEIAKAEALARWRHSTHGFIPPTEFIPLAEETGLINDLGQHMLEQSLGLVREWNRRVGQSHGSGLRRVCVNRSPRQFFSEEGKKDWLQALEQYGVPGEMLCVEITEGLLLDSHSGVMDQLQRMRAGGIDLAIDDFGTGYSALSYLSKFGPEVLKIDRSFIADITTDEGSLAIVESILLMARRLGISTIAEGVETEEQFRMLAAAGCDMAQGYLFARPIPSHEFLDFVSAWNPERGLWQH